MSARDLFDCLAVVKEGRSRVLGICYASAWHTRLDNPSMPTGTGVVTAANSDDSHPSQ